MMVWTILAVYLAIGALCAASRPRGVTRWLVPWARWTWDRTATGEVVDVRCPTAERLLTALVVVLWPLYAVSSWARRT